MLSLASKIAYDFETGKVRRIPFVQLVTHEGHYPFRDANMWRDEDRELPISFLPTEEACEFPDELHRYQFLEPEMTEISFTLPSRRVGLPASVVTQPVSLNLPQPQLAVSSGGSFQDPRQTMQPQAELQQPAVALESPIAHAPMEVPRVETPMMEVKTPSNAPHRLREGPKPNYHPPKQLCRNGGVKAKQIEEQIVMGESDEQSMCHMCTEGCGDKYLSTLLLYNTSEVVVQNASQRNVVPTTKPPSIPAPKNRKDALQSPWWDGYYNAECEEMKSHDINGTWKLVPRRDVPRECTVLRDRWAYSDKLDPSGNSIGRFKARLTAMGCFQKPGADYSETYASVMTTRTFRMILQMYNGHPDNMLLHWDVTTAFVHAPLKERVFMKQASGHEVQGKEDWVYHLVKALHETSSACMATASQDDFSQGKMQLTPK